MILCLDLGNTQIFGGVFAGDTLKLRFRHATTFSSTSDQLGIFLTGVLHQNGIRHKAIQQIALCSVVPSMEYSLRAACIKYFNIDPFVLQATAKMQLTLGYSNPQELGADRLANAIAAIHYFTNRHIIVIDLGTATTLCVINAQKKYLGGAILAGIKLSMSALQNNTAKLFSVEIIKPTAIIGRSTVENLQAGLYYGQLGTMREFVQQITQTYFRDQPPVVIGTGGFSHLFEQEQIFTTIMPDLILQGLRLALLDNRNEP